MNALNPANWSPLRRAGALAAIIVVVIVVGIWVSTNAGPEHPKEADPISTTAMTAEASPTSTASVQATEAATPTRKPVDTKAVTTAAEKNAAGFITAYFTLTPGMQCPTDWLAQIAPYVQDGLAGAQKMFAMSDAGAPTQQGCDAWEEKNASQTVAGAYASAEYVNNQVQAYVGVTTVDKAGVEQESRKTFNLIFDPGTQLITAMK